MNGLIKLILDAKCEAPWANRGARCGLCSTMISHNSQQTRRKIVGRRCAHHGQNFGSEPCACRGAVKAHPLRTGDLWIQGDPLVRKLLSWNQGLHSFRSKRVGQVIQKIGYFRLSRNPVKITSLGPPIC